jgi:hypothetical protein
MCGGFLLYFPNEKAHGDFSFMANRQPILARFADRVSFYTVLFP